MMTEHKALFNMLMKDLHVESAYQSLMLATKVVVFYHGEKCPDGLGSASVVKYWMDSQHGTALEIRQGSELREWSSTMAHLHVNSENQAFQYENMEVIFVPCTYFQAPVIPDLDGAVVLIADFSLWKIQEWYPTLFVDASHIIWLDHHSGAIQETFERTQEGNPLENVYCFLATAFSGAGLCWNFLFDVPMPRHLAHIQDRDAFLWQLDNSTVYLRGFDGNVELTLEAFTDLIALSFKEPAQYAEWCEVQLDTGKIYLKEFYRLVSSAAEKKIPIKINGQEGWLVGGSRLMAHDIGMNVVRKHGKFVGIFEFETADKIKMSLRSMPDGPDVKPLAQKYRGNGHDHASACYLTFAEFSELLQSA